MSDSTNNVSQFFTKAVSAIGFLLVVPGIIMLLLLMSGVRLPVNLIEFYLPPAAPDRPSVLGTVIFLVVVLVLPTIGLVINYGSEKRLLMYVLSSIKYAVTAGFLIVLPFVLLQVTVGRENYTSFPVTVFGALWLFAAMFFMIAIPIVHNPQVREVLLSRPAILVLSIFFLVVLGFSWTGFVADQMPCFLGVPNCD